MALIVGAPSSGADKIKITLDQDEDYQPIFYTLEGDDQVHLYGGGSIQLNTGAGNDWVSNVGTGNVDADLGKGDDFYQSVGLSAVDRVWAGAGNDIVELGKGDDWVKGGGGDDILTGGAGADTFHYPFNATRFQDGTIDTYKSVCAHDIITDFMPGTDNLEFGPDKLDWATFDARFTTSTYDSNGDAIDDSTRLALDGDSSFSISFRNLLIDEQTLYLNTTWYV